jgi:hypothetical protein
MTNSAPLHLPGSTHHGGIVQLHRDVAQNPTNYIHPLDRVQELRRTGWDINGLIREMRTAGYIVTKHIVKAWVKNGLLPPPKK